METHKMGLLVVIWVCYHENMQVFCLWIRLQNHPGDRTCKIVHEWSKLRTGRS